MSLNQGVQAARDSPYRGFAPPFPPLLIPWVVFGNRRKRWRKPLVKEKCKGDWLRRCKSQSASSAWDGVFKRSRRHPSGASRPGCGSVPAAPHSHASVGAHENPFALHVSHLRRAPTASPLTSGMR